MRPETKQNDFEYWEYILYYVDVVICVSHDPTKTLQILQRFLKFRDDKIEKPNMYLCAEVSKMQSSGGEFWIISEENCIKSDVKNLEDVLASRGNRLPSKCNTQLPSSYRSELDT